MEVLGALAREFHRIRDDTGNNNHHYEICEWIHLRRIQFNSISWEASTGWLAGLAVAPTTRVFVFSLKNPAGIEPTKYVVDDPTIAAVLSTHREWGDDSRFQGMAGLWF